MQHNSSYCCKRKCFGVPLHVLKVMSLILVKLNCPVRDDEGFFFFFFLRLYCLCVEKFAFDLT